MCFIVGEWRSSTAAEKNYAMSGCVRILCKIFQINAFNMSYGTL